MESKDDVPSDYYYSEDEWCQESETEDTEDADVPGDEDGTEGEEKEKEEEENAKPLIKYLPDYDKDQKSWEMKKYHIIGMGFRNIMTIPIADGSSVKKMLRETFPALEDVREDTPGGWNGRQPFKPVRTSMIWGPSFTLTRPTRRPPTTRK